MIGFSTVYSQEATANKLSDAEWDKLFSSLEKENWKEAFELSSKGIERLKNDDGADSIANLRYILIYSAAGSVSVGKMTYDELEKELPKVVGKKIATPFRPVGVDCQPPMFNFVCKLAEGEFDVSTTATNQTATSILAFEYAKLAKKFDFAKKHHGKPATLIGTVDKIEPNPNRSTIVIVRIYIKNAEIVMQAEIDAQRKSVGAIISRPGN